MAPLVVAWVAAATDLFTLGLLRIPIARPCEPSVPVDVLWESTISLLNVLRASEPRTCEITTCLSSFLLSFVAALACCVCAEISKVRLLRMSREGILLFPAAYALYGAISIYQLFLLLDSMKFSDPLWYSWSLWKLGIVKNVALTEPDDFLTLGRSLAILVLLGIAVGILIGRRGLELQRAVIDRVGKVVDPRIKIIRIVGGGLLLIVGTWFALEEGVGLYYEVDGSWSRLLWAVAGIVYAVSVIRSARNEKEV